MKKPSWTLGVLLLIVMLGGCDKLGMKDPPKSENVKKLEALAEKACKCADNVCGEAVLAEVDAFAAGIGQVPEADMTYMQNAQTNMDLCLVKVKPFIISYKAAVDEVCTCTNTACAEAAAKKFDAWSKDFKKLTADKKTRISSVDIREITLTGGRAAPCFAKFGVPIPQ